MKSLHLMVSIYKTPQLTLQTLLNHSSTSNQQISILFLSTLSYMASLSTLPCLSCFIYPTLSVFFHPLYPASLLLSTLFYLSCFTCHSLSFFLSALMTTYSTWQCVCICACMHACKQACITIALSTSASL